MPKFGLKLYWNTANIKFTIAIWWKKRLYSGEIQLNQWAIECVLSRELMNEWMNDSRDKAKGGEFIVSLKSMECNNNWKKNDEKRW